MKDDLARIKEDWDDLAVMNAAWFIAPSPLVSNRQWDMAEFYQTGKDNLSHDLRLIDQAGIRIGSGAALDFGCGLGRMTQPMAAVFSPCYGIDISAEMIARARACNMHGDRCRYVVNTRDDLGVFDNGSFSFVYSNNVLQHVPPATMERYLVELIRVLEAGGVLMLQVPIAQLSTDERTARLKGLPRYHPQRVWNKIRTMVAGADRCTWYYRLRRLGVSRQRLYRLGLRPRINMSCLEETRLREISENERCVVTALATYPHDGLLHAKYAIVKRA